MKRVDNSREYLAKLKEDTVNTYIIETELHNLATKQLETIPTPLPIKTFISSSTEVFPLSSLEGITVASVYRTKLAKLEQESDLFQDGLSSEQVRIVMGLQGKRGGYPRDPSVREGDLNAIEDRINEKHEFLQQLSSNTNSIKISRHELELELSRNNAETNPLIHLLGTDNSNQSNKELLLLENSLQAIELRRREANRKRRRLDNNTVCKETELNVINSENLINVTDDNLKTFDINQLTATDPSHMNNYRLSIPEIKQIPRFSCYTSGIPSNKLFIKNLHRKVTLNQLASLFIKFQKIPGPSIKFRLLTGRMKGQAFVELDSIESATEALYYVTGYILMGKPVIVVYASSV